MPKTFKIFGKSRHACATVVYNGQLVNVYYVQPSESTNVYSMHDMPDHSEYPNRAILAANVRRLREASGLSQHALADAAGLSRSTIAAIEGARYKSTDISSVAAIAAVLGLRLEDLTGPNPQTIELDKAIDAFLASVWAEDVKPTEEEIAWLRSLSPAIVSGVEPKPVLVAKLLLWRRDGLFSR